MNMKMIEIIVEKRKIILFVLPFVLLVVPKFFTGLELGDGLPRLGETYYLYKNLDQILLYPLPPIWYYITLSVFAITGSIILAGLVSPILTSILVYLTYLVFSKWFNERIAILTYIFLLFTPELVARGMSSYLEPLAAIFILITLHLYLYAKTNKDIIKSGFVFGIAQLSKYSSLFMIPVFIVHEIITKRSFKKLVLFLAITLIICSPLFIRNYIVYNNPIEPWNTTVTRTQQDYINRMKYFGSWPRFIAMAYSSYYFSSANVGVFIPDEIRFATGAMFFDWGNIITVKTPGGRILKYHIFDILASGILFILMITGFFALYKKDRERFYLVINILFWAMALFIPWSIRVYAPAARYIFYTFPFLALLNTFGFEYVNNKIKNKTFKKIFLVVVILSLLYLYILQIWRAVLFHQYYTDILNHPYISRLFA